MRYSLAGRLAFSSYHIYDTIRRLPRIARLVMVHSTNASLEQLVELRVISNARCSKLDIGRGEDFRPIVAWRDETSLDTEGGNFFPETVHHA